MKKRILALLLAGLLTASLASCINKTPRPDLNGTGTEDEQTQEDTSNQPPSTQITWIEDNTTVYVIASSVTLTNVDDNTDTLKANLMDEFKRVQISSDSKRCVLEKDGKKYYASNSNLSEADLLGKGFTACDKTMYTTGSANVRKYASSESFSDVIKTLTTNTEVKVIATGKEWSKIQYDENNTYFIFSELLSDEKSVDHDATDYSSYFTDLEQELKLYVTASSLIIRKNASTDSSISGHLIKDAEVRAVAKGTIDGTLWYEILVPDEIEEGQTQTYTKGYITDKYVSTTKGGSVVTLDSLLEQYPDFVKKDQTLYVMADSLNVRSTPKFPSKTEKSNIVAGLVKKQEVKVVATGKVEGTEWAMIEYKEDIYYFVALSQLTTDPEGNPAPLTLDELIEKYKLTDIEDKVYYATKDIYYNTTPANADTTTAKKLTKNQKVTVVASGTINYAKWFVFQIEGDTTYYFAGADLFSETQVTE